MYTQLLPVACQQFAETGESLRRAALCLCALAVLTACSGSSSPDTTTPLDESDQSEGGRPDDITGELPDSLLLLEDEAGLLVDIPDVLVTVTTAAYGVQVAYTREGQDARIPATEVESQWLYMQECLGVIGVAPLVIVQQDVVTPFTLTDDVIHDIEGIPVASGSQRAIPVLQIQESEFDAERSNPGFNLRSIMGRLLWLAAGLAERDYPFECAREPSLDQP